MLQRNEVTVKEADEHPARLHFQHGFTIYLDGGNLRDCENDAQERGWWAALDAQIGAEMPASNEPGYDYRTMAGPVHA